MHCRQKIVSNLCTDVDAMKCVMNYLDRATTAVDSVISAAAAGGAVSDAVTTSMMRSAASRIARSVSQLVCE